MHYKLHFMEYPSREDLFRKYVFDHTNNSQLTDSICRINEGIVSGELLPDSPGTTVDELFANMLYEACPCAELLEDLCRIRDLLYGDGSRVLDVDPSYRDAEVSDEPRPKCKEICGVVPLKGEGPSVYDQLREMREWEHIRKFDPMKEQTIIRYNNLSELDKLAVTPVEPSPYYSRF